MTGTCNWPRFFLSRAIGRRNDTTTQRRGVFETKRGIRYEGGWRISHRHGEGSQEWPNGERYHGGWRNDLPDGRGTWLRRGGRYACYVGK